MIDAGLRVAAGFTTRHGGISEGPYASLNLGDHVGDDPAAVQHNRAVVDEWIGAPASYLRPEHGIRVSEITAPGQTPPVADVLVTVTPGVALATVWADCVPLLLHDHGSGAVAAVHAGREGLYAGVVDAAIAALVDIRGGWKRSGIIEAVIGPAICGRCYEVDEPLRERVAQRHPSARSSTRTGTPSLDLPRAVEARLAQLGCGRVTRIARCTAEDADFFSYRADGVTGRCAGLVRCE